MFNKFDDKITLEFINNLLIVLVLSSGGMSIISGYLDIFFVITLFTVSAIMYGVFKLLSLIKKKKLRNIFLTIILLFNVMLTVFLVIDHAKYISYTVSISKMTEENAMLKRCSNYGVEGKKIECTDFNSKKYILNK